MQDSRHKIGKEQEQAALGENDPTINLNGFCCATLLRRREKPFEHLQVKLLHSGWSSRAFA